MKIDSMRIEEILNSAEQNLKLRKLSTVKRNAMADMIIEIRIAIRAEVSGGTQ